MTARETVFVFTSGSIYKMDVPTDTQARERFDAALESGTYRIVDPEHVEEDVLPITGGTVLRLKPGAPEPAKSPAKKPAVKKSAAKKPG